jgi:hypothetical protein
VALAEASPTNHKRLIGEINNEYEKLKKAGKHPVTPLGLIAFTMSFKPEPTYENCCPEALKKQNAELQACNNRLLERAREAENKLKKVHKHVMRRSSK